MSTQISRPDVDLQEVSGPSSGSPVGGVDGVATTAVPPEAAPGQASTAPESKSGEAGANTVPKVAKARRPRRGAPVWRWDAPSWGVSLMVHVAVLMALALVAAGNQVDQLLGPIDASLTDASRAEEDLTALYAEPSADERELAVEDPTSILDPGAAPSATPAISSNPADVTEGRSLVKLVPVSGPPTSTEMIPSTSDLNEDLSGDHQISGETGRPTTDYGEALDQLAREILAHLATSQVTVLWMFDESGSMKDDQRTIRDRFDRVINTLQGHVPSERRAAGDLEHAIIGFGERIHFENSPPRSDLEEIRKAIDSLRVDESGVENTMKAVVEAINRYSRVVSRDRKILLVLITDESGDDGDLVEQARLALVNRRVTAYVLGRQSMFGYDKVHLRYTDPVTGDVYWPTIDRGPETAGLELLQWDGLWKNRHDEQPSGFAPYELARLVMDTGGIFFLLPNEEELRNRPSGEKAYPYAQLKEYSPDYSPRADYAGRVSQSELRRTMHEVIQLTRNDFGFERHFPVNPPELAQKIATEAPKAEIQLRALLEIEKNLRRMEPARDKEANRRWQANYDLMLAQVVAFQVKAYEYRACLAEMVSLANQGKLTPQKPPIPNQRRTDWVIDHSSKKKAPAEETEKKYAEATALLEAVITNHPDTPWADLAQTILNRGLGCDWSEWNVHPDYDKRAALVPKY